MHQIKSVLLLLGIFAVFSIISFSLFGWVGALAVLGIGLAVQGFAQQRGAGLILRFHRAREVDPQEAPILHRIAAELAARASMPIPQLMVYPSEMPNAFAIGTGKTHGVVAVSSGLLSLLDRREVTGVLAHEFAHLKNRDSSLSALAGLVVQATTSVSHLFGFAVLLLLLSGAWGTAGVSLWSEIVLFALAPTGTALLLAAFMRTRERLADEDAAKLTGDPRGLASALYKLQEFSKSLERYLRRFRFIHTVEQDRGAALLRSHPSTRERVEALVNMDAKLVRHPAYRLPAYPQWRSVASF
jgi:heat shock protein HtpX